MTTARKSRKPARKPARRNASCRAACGMSRKNPTTYARKLPSPFNRFTARDWARARSIAYQLQMESYGDAYVEEMFSTGYAAVGFDDSGAYLEAHHERLPHAEWPLATKITARDKWKNELGTKRRSKRAVGSTRAKRTRKVNQRSNPRRKKAAGARKARRNPKAQSGFRRGQRVELHPGTDRWMMGDRYGTVSAANARGGKVRVKLDRSGESLLFAPDRLLLVD